MCIFFSMGGYMIRKAAAAELEQIMTMEQQYMEEYEQNDLNRWLQSREKIKGTFKEKLDQFIVYEQDGVQGFCYWDMLDNLPCIYSIYVSQANRGRGIGRQLIDGIEKLILHSKHHTVVLSTRIENPAQYLFDKTGYTRLEKRNGWIQYKKHI